VPDVKAKLFLTKYPQESEGLCKHISAASNPQRCGGLRPTHKKFLQSQKLGIGVIGVFHHPVKTSFFYLAGWLAI
jgi:hypothetical protein